MTTHSLETAYTIDTSSIKFGPGVTREVGHEMNRLGARRVMVVTDARMAGSEAVAVTLESLRDEGIDAVLFDRVSVEPTDVSFKEAIEFATDGELRRVCCRWRRFEHRHCEGGEPVRYMARGLSGVCERANRGGQAGAGAAEAADCDTHDFGDGQRDDWGSRYSTFWRWRRRRA